MIVTIVFSLEIFSNILILLSDNYCIKSLFNRDFNKSI
ncbi:hypothetical protein LEP1GSC110_3824 [Leptospira interrogans serovar Medanensis str. UT053]|nr:hypothetical protein LEP1GSC110_3824 [Leptospira interrogans serovar Medanensis str. UT053]